MSTLDILVRIQNSSIAHAISKSNHLVGAALQIVHVLGVILLLSSLVLISLRLLGFALRQQSIPDVARDAGRLMWVGLALAVISGTLMFVSSPRLYYYNEAFELKMLLLAFAVIVQLFLFRIVRTDAPVPVALTRSTVVLALLCWFGVGLAGRIIGFI